MKKIIPFILVVALAGCAKKEWSKDYLTKKCNKEMMKNDNSGMVGKDKIEKICDCVADKMMTRYKSEADANRAGEAAGAALGRECAMEVLMPGQ